MNRTWWPHLTSTHGVRVKRWVWLLLSTLNSFCFAFVVVLKHNTPQQVVQSVMTKGFVALETRLLTGEWQ